ncbi:MAG TPA: hypothetical protein PKY56_04890, partial [Candidatus Kapabacteria bacterium]|nr:hypothetical protein [Candidatus Kapabacteria bacterium]
MKKFSLTFLLLVVCFQCLSYSQQPPCMPEYHALTFEYPKYPYLPYYTTDMPYEVMLGYIVMDSVCNYGNALLLDDFISRQTYNDTIKTIMKYIYRMADWDPYLFKRTQYSLPTNKLHPATVIEKLIEKSASLSSNYKLYKLILSSHFILHINVTDTLSRTYLSSNIPTPVAIVNYEVLDTIKGRKIPVCKNVSIDNNTKITSQEESQIVSNNCSQFGYSLFWERDSVRNDIKFIGGHDYSKSLIDKDGILWTNKGKEYIVCLYIPLICETSYYDYSSITSNVIPSLTCTMYPIENGNVQDPGNEFGFGTNVDVDQFKLLL